MGNYYEGSLTFILKKDIKKEILNDLIILSDTYALMGDELEKFDISVFSDELRKTNLLKHERWSWPHYELYKIYYNPNGKDFYEKYILTDYNESKEELEEIKDLNICNYRLNIRFNMKHYLNNKLDLGIILCNFLKPYIDENIYDMNEGGYIGTIRDEDFTYRKEFYINQFFLKEKLKEREFLCQNCNYYLHDSLCENYDLCKRAYDIGLKNGENKWKKLDI